MSEELLTNKEVRERLKVSRMTVHRLVKAGALNPVKIGTVVRYKASELNPKQK